MMLAWIAYILILTALLGITALAIEQLSRRSGWATRWVWAGAMVASLAIPTTLLVIPREAAPPSVIVSATPLAVLGAESHVSVVADSPLATISSVLPTLSLNSSLIAGWATLSALMIAILALSWLRLRRAAGSWTSARVAGRTVFISDDLGPAVVGFFPARIVLPRWMLNADAAVQRLTVLHESQHLSARDPQLILAALTCIALMPWNLGLWWLFQRLRTAVEVDCDARVLHSGEDVVTYGGALLEVANSNARTPMLAPALIEPKTQLERRIALLGTSSATLSKPMAVAATVLLLSIAGGAMAQIAAPQSLRVSAATSNASAALGPKLLDALLEGDSARATELIDAGADLNYRRSGDGTPLIVAARKGDSALVQLMLAKGADANLESPADGNPLIVAAATGNESIATMLVAAGANANAFVGDDETPLIKAARGGHLNVVKFLLDQGADANFSTIANKLLAPERRSALSEAEKHGHHDVAAYLRANGAKR